MGKHDHAKRQKEIRNLRYAKRYLQLVCKKCGHRSCKPGNCKLCGAARSERRPRKP